MTSLNLDQVGVLVVLGMAVGVVSMTISKASIFERLRVWIDRESEWLGDLVSCPYCTSHWVALVAVIAFEPRPLQTQWDLLDMVAAVFAVTFVSSVACGAIAWAFGGDE